MTLFQNRNFTANFKSIPEGGGFMIRPAFAEAASRRQVVVSRSDHKENFLSVLWVSAMNLNERR
jgi:hypothetical protein